MTTPQKRTVLVLDDDEINLMILVKGVQEAGYMAKPFSGGAEALAYMKSHPGEINIALLDKMMPGMTGLEVLRKMKEDESLRRIPAIIQTGDAGVEQMREGLESGAYYYLTKPFHPEILMALLHAATAECKVQEEMGKQAAGGTDVIRMLQKGEFVLHTHSEARRICAVISQSAVYPEFVVVGLMELLANAIEHGNLAIGHDRKRDCMMDGTWEQEITARTLNPKYASRSVRMKFEKTRGGLYIVINDQGKGFDWHHQADHLALLKLNQPNGRGISKAMVMLDDVRFIGNGSEVHCSVKLQPSANASNDDAPVSEEQKA